MSLLLFALITVLLILLLREPPVYIQVQGTVLQKKVVEHSAYRPQMYHPQTPFFEPLEYTFISRGVELDLDFPPHSKQTVFSDEAYDLLPEKQKVTVILKINTNKNGVLYTVSKIITPDGKIIQL